MAEHDLLREHHVRDERGFALSHRATCHTHDGQFVDKPAVSRLEVPQTVERNIFSPAVEKQPRHRYDAPPREVAEDDLQVNEQLADLHIEVCDVKTQHEIEVVCKEARDDTCKVEVEYPQDYPAYPYCLMLPQKCYVRLYCPLYRLVSVL